jgi:glutamate---cysteine ligase / carboxylate-amine ligase
MHPWMDPRRETRLWPHGNRAIYKTFDRLFDCRGHGWSNLQSTHLNLPFRGDEEFRRLHTAIRLLLPLLPALAASSPFVEGRAAPMLDMRLEVYRHNCARVPSIAGRIVPEWVPTPACYEERILARIQRDLEPLDPERRLHAEWVNARGAIARSTARPSSSASSTFRSARARISRFCNSLWKC